MTEQFTLAISQELTAAIVEKRPVVALESTVIAHGLSRPQNLETAQRSEEVVTTQGATPATIAILGGKPTVGLTAEQLNHIAQDDDIHKISVRDLPVAVARQWDGATTVASTVWIAHRAGIEVLATGGIGGVHRGRLPDVSADLPELAATPIVVVCSGAKIVLDLPATREWLETHGITVVGYECDEMPAFYSRQSGLAVDVRCDSSREVAELWRAQRALGIQRALLVTVPVPVEDGMPTETLNTILEESLKAANEAKIGGRDLTPFLLARMAKESVGATLRANISLLENNARVAAEIAREIKRT
jgi:pseudouridine-5'-phosphate glycosidase